MDMHKYLLISLLLQLFFFLNVLETMAQNRIVVSKKSLELMILNAKSDTICRYRCGLGLNKGDKQEIGDYKTPEGVFSVSAILDSKKWTHDFNDGYGIREGAYGPYFIRLTVPGFTGIGIHGTCFPESIGSRCSEGCVRLKNEDLEKLIHFVWIGMEVCIEKDYDICP